MKSLYPLRPHRLHPLVLRLAGVLSITMLAAQGAAGTDGLYATTDNNYRIEVKFAPGKLQVVEPNKTSDYLQRAGNGIYDFKNLLVVEYVDKPYQGDHFDRLALAVEKAKDGKINILDRSKPKTTP